MYIAVGAEKNASALIDKLLRQHFQISTGKSIEELHMEVEKQRGELDKMVQIKEKEIQKVEENITKVETEELTLQEKDAEIVLKKEKRIDSVAKLFKKELGFELKREELEKYLYLLDANQTDFFMYADEMKFKYLHAT